MANKVVRPLNPRLSVNFRAETANGLVLCLSDINDSNFMVDIMGNLWAIDFGRTSFLPPSFVYYSLALSPSPFGRRVARRINYPQSANFPGMVIAAGQLVVYNDNSLGKQPLSILSRYAASTTNRIGTAVKQPPSGSTELSNGQISLEA